MSCHTWVYKKYNSCTREEKDKFIKRVDKLDSQLKSYEDFRESTIKCSKLYMSRYPKNSKEYNAWLKWMDEDVMKRRWTEKNKNYIEFQDGLNDDNILKYCSIEDSADFAVVNGELYIQYNFDYPFRVYDYPDESFTSKEELLLWLSKIEETKVCYKDGNGFIYGYTAQLIKRINDFFAENGEDNLYFDFV